MERDLTIKEVAEITGFSYNTIYANRHKLKAYQINPTRKGHWRIKRENIDNLYKMNNNVTSMRLASEELELCQSTEIKTQDTGTLICQQRAASELDALLAQPTKPKRKSFMTA
ncbi:helix-turn-helix domain-containing protein [Oligella urethralis]|uniref:helix-turn-helix domain-containing protein n=1 Tax=Oligella urethralis TaxID=90245 RepID=UPI0006921939